MGRSRGTMEKHLDPSEVESLAEKIKNGMSDVVRGCMQAAPGKVFKEFATHSDWEFN